MCARITRRAWRSSSASASQLVKEPLLEAAVYNFNVLSMAGTGIIISAVLAGLMMGYSFRQLVKEYWETIKLVRFSLMTICAMFAVGYLT